MRQQLIDVLGLRDCRFEYGVLIGHPPRLEQDGTIVTRYSHIDGELAGMPTEEVELRRFGNGQHYGRCMLTPAPGSKPSLRARLVAVTLADLAGRRWYLRCYTGQSADAGPHRCCPYLPACPGSSAVAGVPGGPMPGRPGMGPRLLARTRGCVWVEPVAWDPLIQALGFSRTISAFSAVANTVQPA